MRQTSLIVIVVSVLLGWNQSSLAQRTKVWGKVTDGATGQPLPFVNVVFKGSSVGTVTDTLGLYKLEAGRKFDSLQVSFTGYFMATLPIRSADANGKLDVALRPRSFELAEVKVRPGENPAWKILRKVIERKAANAPSNLNAFEYTAYHRVQFDLNHFTDKAKNNILLKPFDYIWDGADTTPDGVRYLPILLSENHERHFWRKNPEARRREVSATRTYKFFKAPRIMEFVNDMHVDPDVYRNNVVILDRTFPSPINDNFRLYYRYALDDSVRTHNGHRCYLITFRPQGEADVAFRGQMLIDSVSYAVAQVDLEFSIEANVNFVRNYYIRQDFSWVDGKQWFLTQSRVLADFTVVENAKDLTGFFGRKTTTITGIVIDSLRNDEFYRGIGGTLVADSAELRPESYWQQVRPDTFSQEEKQLVQMVTHMNNDPRWKRTEAILHAIAENWLPLGPIELGDILTFYTYNRYEGHRVKLGLRTSEKLSRKVRITSYLAYGIGDEKLKNYFEAQYTPVQKFGNHTTANLNYRFDMLQPGRHPTVQPLDNIINSFIKLSGSSFWLLQERLGAHIERQWVPGITTRLDGFSEGLTGLDSPFWREGTLSPEKRQTIHHSGFGLTLRWCHGLGQLPGGYDDLVPGIFPPEFPVVSLNLMAGFKGLWDGQFTYQHLRLKVEQRLRANRAGHLWILAEGGYIFGDAPWPALYHPSANPLIFNNQRSYNLLNFMEFVSDRYVSLHLEHHFDGLLFNLIPWVNKLKLREVVFARGYWGEYANFNVTNSYVPPINGKMNGLPYVEVGFGIENILKVASINFSWRLTHLDSPGALPFIVKPGYVLRF